MCEGRPRCAIADNRADTVDTLEHELCRFYDVDGLSTEAMICASARQSTPSTSLTPAQRA